MKFNFEIFKMKLEIYRQYSRKTELSETFSYIRKALSRKRYTEKRGRLVITIRMYD